MTGFNAEANRLRFLPIWTKLSMMSLGTLFGQCGDNQKPKQVREASKTTILGRHTMPTSTGVLHTLAERATAAYEAARERVRSFINAASDREVLFQLRGNHYHWVKAPVCG